jgi:fructokinase
VGDDDFGQFWPTVKVAGVTLGRVFRLRPTVGVCVLRSDGERSFMFYRHPSADMLWRPEDVDRVRIRHTDFHHGSISINEPSRAPRWLRSGTPATAR